MAVVIPFQPRPRSTAAEGAASREGTILFFTGVRYERVAEPAAPKPRAARRAPSVKRSRSRQPA